MAYVTCEYFELKSLLDRRGNSDKCSHFNPQQKGKRNRKRYELFNNYNCIIMIAVPLRTIRGYTTYTPCGT
jgi:hypothetical protein